MTEPAQDKTDVFDYDRVMVIANRLDELGIPKETIDDIKEWAAKRRDEENDRVEEVAT